MPWLDNLQALLRRVRRSRDPPTTIVLSSSGITGISVGSTPHIPWSEVLEIVAWKQDCYVVDQIAVLIRSTEHLILCTEANTDMASLSSEIFLHLPASHPAWYLLLLTAPAFEPTRTHVYPLPQVN